MKQGNTLQEFLHCRLPQEVFMKFMNHYEPMSWMFNIKHNETPLPPFL